MSEINPVNIGFGLMQTPIQVPMISIPMALETYYSIPCYEANTKKLLKKEKTRLHKSCKLKRHMTPNDCQCKCGHKGRKSNDPKDAPIEYKK